MRFGEKIVVEGQALPAAWREQLIDYSQLKKSLKVAADTANSGGDTPAVKQLLRNSFQHLLDSEIEKALAHYKCQSSKLCKEVDNLKVRNADVFACIEEEDVPIEDVKTLADRWMSMANLLRSLLLYITLNSKALRKIMKKYGKMEGLQAVGNRPGLTQLEFRHESLPGGVIEQGSFMPASIVEEIDRMKDHSELVEVNGAIKKAFKELEEMRNILQMKKPGSLRNTRSNMEALQHEITSLRDFPQMADTLDDAERNAQMNLNVIQATPQVMEQYAGIFTPPPPDHKAFATMPGLIINLLSAFLYMVNYNLVLPTNEEFCLHIGSSSSMAGIIIGFADLTAIGISVLYGWWTGRSFKQPLMASAMCCLLGNVLYCLAWDAKNGGLALLLIARLLTGMGSARAVNRRYIADFVSKKRRTAASAAFVGASAAGTAIGPLLASPLERIVSTKILGGLTFNAVTAGGWIMVIVWFVFSLLVMCCFEDPPQNFESEESDDEESVIHSIVTSTQQSDSDAALSKPLLPEQSKQERAYDMQPIFVCLVSLFSLKLLQQGMLSSVSIITVHFYSWGISLVSMFLAALSFGMLPVNFLLAVIASFASDRNLLVIAEVTSLIGALFLLSYGGTIPNMVLYIIGTVLIFSATIVMEAVSMSLLSKRMPPDMAKGMCNAGLLATQAGSFGRLSGNMIITLFGTLLGGIDTLQKVLHFDCIMYGTLIVVQGGTFAYSALKYKNLET